MVQLDTNCRAELGVKQMKRIIADNCSPSGSLDVDRFQQAILSYRNTIDPITKSSPAIVLFGRPIRDMIPVPIGKYTPHETWRELMDHREKAKAKRHSLGHEQWSEHVRNLPALSVGDHVYIQNQVGNNPRRWERTGVIVEVKQHDQYNVKVDGSGRVTLRNRKYLRKFVPFMSEPRYLPTSSQPTAPAAPGPVLIPTEASPKTLASSPPRTPPAMPPSGTLPIPSLTSPTTSGVNTTLARRLSFESPTTSPRSSSNSPAPASPQEEQQIPSISTSPLKKKGSRMLNEVKPWNNQGIKEDPIVQTRLRKRT